MRRIVSAVAALAAVAAVAATPASAQTTPTYYVSGIETGIPAPAGGDESTSPFAGAAFSWTAGLATWTADVTHHALDSTDCGSPSLIHCITGGDFAISGGSPISGTFTDGSITRVFGRSSPPCTSKVAYRVIGGVDLAPEGTATFTARLTHYQVQLFGSCVPYFATVSGSFGP